jgi:hypothetical protein
MDTATDGRCTPSFPRQQRTYEPVFNVAVENTETPPKKLTFRGFFSIGLPKAIGPLKITTFFLYWAVKDNQIFSTSAPGRPSDSRSSLLSLSTRTLRRRRATSRRHLPHHRLPAHAPSSTVEAPPLAAVCRGRLSFGRAVRPATPPSTEARAVR